MWQQLTQGASAPPPPGLMPDKATIFVAFLDLRHSAPEAWHM